MSTQWIWPHSLGASVQHHNTCQDGGCLHHQFAPLFPKIASFDFCPILHFSALSGLILVIFISFLQNWTNWILPNPTSFLHTRNFWFGKFFSKFAWTDFCPFSPFLSYPSVITFWFSPLLSKIACTHLFLPILAFFWLIRT